MNQVKRILVVLMFCGVVSSQVHADRTASASASVEETIERSAFRPVPPTKLASAASTLSKPRPVSVKIFPMYSKLPRSGKCLVAVEMLIKDGWHVNANPAMPAFLVPTTLEVKSKQKVKLLKVKYPNSHRLNVKGSPDPYHVYDGKAFVYGLLEVDPKETADVADMGISRELSGLQRRSMPSAR